MFKISQKKNKVNSLIVPSCLNAFSTQWSTVAPLILKFLETKRSAELKTYLKSVQQFTQEGVYEWNLTIKNWKKKINKKLNYKKKN